MHARRTASTSVESPDKPSNAVVVAEAAPSALAAAHNVIKAHAAAAHMFAPRVPRPMVMIPSPGTRPGSRYDLPANSLADVAAKRARRAEEATPAQTIVPPPNPPPHVFPPAQPAVAAAAGMGSSLAVGLAAERPLSWHPLQAQPAARPAAIAQAQPQDPPMRAQWYRMRVLPKPKKAKTTADVAKAVSLMEAGANKKDLVWSFGGTCEGVKPSEEGGGGACGCCGRRRTLLTGESR